MAGHHPRVSTGGAADRTLPLYPETVNLIRDMSPSQIWTRYVRYIGAGAVATAGILTLIRSLPLMVESFRVGARQLRSRVGAGEAEALPRTDRDLSLLVVGAGVIIYCPGAGDCAGRILYPRQRAGAGGWLPPA